MNFDEAVAATLEARRLRWIVLLDVVLILLCWMVTR